MRRVSEREGDGECGGESYMVRQEHEIASHPILPSTPPPAVRREVVCAGHHTRGGRRVSEQEGDGEGGGERGVVRREHRTAGEAGRRGKEKGGILRGDTGGWVCLSEWIRGVGMSVCGESGRGEGRGGGHESRSRCGG